VASGVGGLLTLVDEGVNGFLVPDRDPAAFARHIAAILDDPMLAARLGAGGARRARGYTWALAAARLRRIYADLAVRELVACA
jgi:glycosyltransferase involved in cell wall biosynthesis